MRRLRQAVLVGLPDQLKRLSDCGDLLEKMSRVVSFGVFRPALEKALAYDDGVKSEQRQLYPGANNQGADSDSAERGQQPANRVLIRHRLSWLRFVSFEPGSVTPDDNLIRLFSRKLTCAGEIDALFTALDRHLCERGYL